MVCAHAFAEIESPAEADAHLLCGSDDQIAIWLNGWKIHDFAGTHSYKPDSDNVPLRAAGKNAHLVKIGNQGGTWEFGVRIPGVDGGKFTLPKDAQPDAKQRAYVLAQNADGTWTHRGDAERGEKIFHDPTGPFDGICAQCHKIRGLGVEVGPDLTLVGSVYKRGDLLTSIMEPGKTIALGFEQIIVETKAGDLFAGAIQRHRRHPHPPRRRPPAAPREESRHQNPQTPRDLHHAPRPDPRPPARSHRRPPRLPRKPAGELNARRAHPSQKQAVILNGVSPRAKAAGETQRGSLKVTRAEAVGESAAHSPPPPTPKPSGKLAYA